MSAPASALSAKALPSRRVMIALFVMLFCGLVEVQTSHISKASEIPDPGYFFGGEVVRTLLYTRYRVYANPYRRETIVDIQGTTLILAERLVP